MAARLSSFEHELSNYSTSILKIVKVQRETKQLQDMKNCECVEIGRVSELPSLWYLVCPISLLSSITQCMSRFQCIHPSSLKSFIRLHLPHPRTSNDTLRPMENREINLVILEIPFSLRRLIIASCQTTFFIQFVSLPTQETWWNYTIRVKLGLQILCRYLYIFWSLPLPPPATLQSQPREQLLTPLLDG